MMRGLDHRVPPPLLMLAIGAAMACSLLGGPPPALPDPWRWAAAAALALAAGLFAFPAFAGFSKAGTTIDPVRIERASTLVTAGIFRVTRNPMYVALALLLCAWAAWLARPLPVLGPAAFILFVDRFQIRPEERVLAARFGSAYAAYRASVRRWL